MSTPKIQPFKLSNLPAVANLEDKDLFLVSDYEGGKCYTRSLTFGNMVKTIMQNDELRNIIQKQADEYFKNNLSAKVIETIRDNYATVWDLLDGKKDDKNTISGGDANSVNGILTGGEA